jgi:hypothetical protein
VVRSILHFLPIRSDRTVYASRAKEARVTFCTEHRRTACGHWDLPLRGIALSTAHQAYHRSTPRTNEAIQVQQQHLLLGSNIARPKAGNRPVAKSTKSPNSVHIASFIRVRSTET